MKNRNSFTLIELLVTLAIVAVLSVVVILTLNPSELLKQARDSNRLSDLATINTALNLFSTDVTSGFMGTSTIIYVSVPDTSPTCANLGLPAIPTSTYTYSCVTSANLRNTDGTGWIPVNFNRISSNSPISQLPIDPQNTTSTKYYAYVTGGSWKVIATPESQKYLATAVNDGGIGLGQFEMGNNMNLAPFIDGLLGWWKFDEGNGTSTVDSSGWGSLGTASGTSVVSGVAGNARNFNGTVDYVYIPDSDIWDFGSNESFTLSAWIKYSSTALSTILADDNAQTSGGWILRTDSPGKPAFYVVNNPNRSYQVITAANAYNDNNWHLVTAVRDAAVRQIKIFVDGVSAASPIADSGYNATPPAGVYPAIGRNSTYAVQYYFPGLVDDVRVYNRALSSVEILTLYNTTK